MSIEPRTWPGWASQRPNGFIGIATDRRTAEALNPARGLLDVNLVEDPDGDYRGWIPTGKPQPIMVHHHRVFEMCFPYGSTAEQEAGRGEPVILRVETYKPS